MDNQPIKEHAVIIYFKYGIESLDPLYNLEDKLTGVIIEKKVGKYDGHEIANTRHCPDASSNNPYLLYPRAAMKKRKKQQFIDMTITGKRYE